MKAWKKWIISLAVCLAATASVGAMTSFAACGGNTSSEKSNDNECTVTFNTCTDLKTNKLNPKKVEKGGKLSLPILVVLDDNNPGNSEVVGWYLDPEYTMEWDFATDTVQEDITLYAKWSDSYAIIYYLGEDTEKEFFREYVKEGGYLQRNDVLADGYHSEGFFADPEHTIPFDFTQPITAETNVYIQRSDELYFSGDMIARRFTPKAAMSGAGSTTGTITAETNDAGETYAKMNFGYSTAADPHMMLENVLVDITHSQKLRITYKNLGESEAMSLYFIVTDEKGKALPGYEQFTEKTCVKHYFAEDEKNMDPNGEWKTVEIDMAGGSIDNGISVWANGAYLNRLRFQSGYVSENADDLSNEIWVKSIEGVYDSTYVGTEDSAEIQEICQDDDKTLTDSIGAAQDNVVGWVFPKDFASVRVNGDVSMYKKTNGLLLHASYGKTGSLVFSAGDEVINLDELTTLKIRLRNYGHATKITLRYRNLMSDWENVDLNIDPSMGEVAEYKLNLFGADDYVGQLDNLTLTYSSVGNDNAILIESIVFDEFESIQTPGFNFDDKYYNGATTNAQMEVSYDKVRKGTKFKILEDGASYTKEYDHSNSMFGYKQMELNYVKSEEGVTALIVDLTVNGQTESYRYNLQVGNGLQAISAALYKTGNLERVKFTFEGTGEVVIKDLKFKLDSESDFDFSTASLTNKILAEKWSSSLSFDVSLSAVYYTKTAGTDLFKYYPGVVYGKNPSYGAGSVSLEGKTKISVVYQNRGEANSLNIAIGLADKLGEDWKTAHSEPYAQTSGGARSVQILGGMAENEWAHVEIDLSKYNNIDATTINEKVLTCILVELVNNGSVYIRSISLIDGDSPDGDVTDTYSVNYYAGETLVHTDKVEEGAVIEGTPSLDSAYKVLGYYTDATYTTPFDFTQPIMGATDIYVQLSEGIYFNADYIQDNFKMAAAAGPSSVAGTMETVGEGEDAYLKINFGYSTTGDPHALMKDASVDISKSQKLRITFKYFGKGANIKMYFVAQDENGQFVGGSKFFSEATCINYNFKSNEINMSEDDEWVTVELDAAALTMQNGVSLWGTAKTLTMFRFQVSYVSENADDSSNEIWVKSIEGIADDTYTGVNDSEEVAGLLQDDSSAETGSVAATQEQVKGWIFPKNYANTEVDGCNVYDKANGLLMHTAYGVSSTLTLKVPDGVNVSLDDLTTLTLKLKNFGYVASLQLMIKNTAGNVVVRDVAIDARMENAAEYKLNLFGLEGYSGELAEVIIAYTSVGNDNAVLLESVVFSEFESTQVVGVNFNDKNYGGAANTAQMTVAYDMAVKGTKFNILESGASYTKAFTKFSMLGYKNIVLNYVMANAGVTAVKVGVTIDGATDTYTYTMSASNEPQSLSLALSRSGAIQSMSITFEGVGEITLQSVEFALDKANSINFNDEWLVNFLTTEAYWAKGTSYVQDLSAMQYTVSEVGGFNLFKYYPGNILDSRKYGEGNIPLTGKSKIVLVYQNRSAEHTYINLGLGHTSIVEGDAWKTTIAEPGSNTKSVVLEKSMAEDEWASVEIDLTAFNDFTSQEVIDTQAAACILVQLSTVGTIYVRSISII